MAYVDALLNAGLLVVALLALALAKLPIVSPGLYAPRPVFKFGTVNQGDTVYAAFTVRNLHPWTVTITSVRGGCGCTRPVADRDLPTRIPPLGTVTVLAQLDTTTKRGTVDVPVIAVTSEPEHETNLSITGMVRER